jgi:hypothetical protein
MNHPRFCSSWQMPVNVAALLARAVAAFFLQTQRMNRVATAWANARECSGAACPRCGCLLPSNQIHEPRGHGASKQRRYIHAISRKREDGSFVIRMLSSARIFSIFF